MSDCRRNDNGGIAQRLACMTGSYSQMRFSAVSVTQLAPPMMYMSVPTVRVCGCQGQAWGCMEASRTASHMLRVAVSISIAHASQTRI